MRAEAPAPILRLKPDERLNAFLQHSQLTLALMRAGRPDSQAPTRRSRSEPFNPGSPHVPFRGTVITVPGREDRIAAERYAGRPRDPADAAAAIEVARDALNLVLPRALVPGYGLDPAERLERLRAPPSA